MEERCDPDHTVLRREPDALGRLEGRVNQVPVRVLNALRSRGVDDSQEVSGGIGPGRLEIPADPGRDEILQLDDAVVVPEILLADRDHLLQVEKVGTEILECLEVIDALKHLRGHGIESAGVEQPVVELRPG